MRVVYIAGPYRANNAWDIEQNIRRAEHAALMVWAAGMVALCPHTETRFFQGYLPDAVWLAGDLELLSRCDAVLLLPGWERSLGTQAEHKFARAKGIPCFGSLVELEMWKEGEVNQAPLPLPTPMFKDRGVG